MKFSSIKNIVPLLRFLVLCLFVFFGLCFFFFFVCVLKTKNRNEIGKTNRRIHSTQQSQHVTKVKSKNRMYESAIGVFIFIHFHFVIENVFQISLSHRWPKNVWFVHSCVCVWVVDFFGVAFYLRDSWLVWCVNISIRYCNE